MSFFVTSATSATGNLGGLAGADATCQRLATAAGQGSRTWRAYLSVERDPANANQLTHARDRIGTGPWYNASLILVANNIAELHSRPGDADFVPRRARAAHQRPVGRLAGSGPARHPHRVERRWNTPSWIDVLGLDVRFSRSGGTGGAFGRDGSPTEHHPSAVVVELGARQPELRRHGAARRGREVLLLRPVAGSVVRILPAAVDIELALP